MSDKTESALPERRLLSDQVVDFLRNGIRSGRWRKELPSEADLCRELKVSRFTIRRAIEQLATEKWVVLGGRGFRHKIRRPQKKATMPETGHIVRWLTPYHPYDMGSAHQQMRRALSERIGSAGYRIEIEYRPKVYESTRASELERFDSMPDTAGWIVTYSNEAMQRWFESRRRPCVLLGAPFHESIDLASVYLDTKAIARHVVGRFYSRGHRELAYLKAEITSLGDQRCADEFLRVAADLGARVTVVNHENTQEAVCRAIEGLLARRPSPTAWFSGCPEHCIAILCRMQSLGLQVPRDVSVVSGWDSSVLKFTVPPITCYRIDADAMGRKMGDLLLGQLRHGSGRTQIIPMMPEFLPGGTLNEGR